MEITLYDQLRGQNVTISNQSRPIKIFNCGPTVSDYIHIGHVRNALLPDLLLKVLHVLGWNEVVSITNVTNISDKIFQRSTREENSWESVGDHFLKEWQTDLLSCNISLPNIIMPDTKHVNKIIEFIQKLIVMQAAYVKDQTVFFDRSFVMESSNLHKYNQSVVKTDLIRQIVHDHEDFILWDSLPDSTEMVWESPWGIGRPGKHIPCSDVIHEHCHHDDLIIHCGGNDLLAHHSCEFAQNMAVSNGETVADVWLYNSLVHVDGKKMGKSLGNSITVRELLSKYDHNAIRWYLLSTPFDEQIEFDVTEFEHAAGEWDFVSQLFCRFSGQKVQVSDEQFYMLLVKLLAENLRVDRVIQVMKSNFGEFAKNEKMAMTACYLLSKLGFTID